MALLTDATIVVSALPYRVHFAYSARGTSPAAERGRAR